MDDRLTNGISTAVPLTDEQAAQLLRRANLLSQLSNILCGKELATLEELLQGASQVKSELALAVLQRDAAIRHLHGNCDICKWYETENCAYCIHDPDAWNTSEDNWEWVGGYPENTEVQEDVAE